MRFVSGLRLAGVTLLAALLAGTTAHATTWTLSGVADATGGAITGTFTTDGSGLLTSWDIVESGSSISALNVTYSSVSQPLGSSYVTSTHFDLSDSPGNNNLYLVFSAPLTSAGPLTILPTVMPTGYAGATSVLFDTYADPIYIVSGQADVPEPASMALLGLGMIAFGAVRRYAGS